MLDYFRLLNDPTTLDNLRLLNNLKSLSHLSSVCNCRTLIIHRSLTPEMDISMKIIFHDSASLRMYFRTGEQRRGRAVTVA